MLAWLDQLAAQAAQQAEARWGSSGSLKRRPISSVYNNFLRERDSRAAEGAICAMQLGTQRLLRQTVATVKMG